MNVYFLRIAVAVISACDDTVSIYAQFLRFFAVGSSPLFWAGNAYIQICASSPSYRKTVFHVFLHTI